MTDVQAYFYESRIDDGVGGGGWSRCVREAHPESIGNISFRNLQRLVEPDDLESDDRDVVAYLYELDGTATDSWNEHVDRFQNLEAIENREDIRNIRPLVPHPDDVGEGPEPEPIRKRGGSEYYVDRQDEGTDVYYCVNPQEDEAEVLKEDATTPREIRMYELWQRDRRNSFEYVHYDETPFSAPKYR